MIHFIGTAFKSLRSYLAHCCLAVHDNLKEMCIVSLLEHCSYIGH